MIPGEEKIRAVISDFDLLKIDKVVSIKLYFSYSDQYDKNQKTDALINFTYWSKGLCYLISLELHDIKKLSFPDFGTSMFELGELDIYPVRTPSVEGENYCLDDTLDGMFCKCAHLEFSSIEPWSMQDT